MCSLQFKPAHLNMLEGCAQVCRRRLNIKWTICQQNSRDLGARVIKYPAADHHTPEKRFARLPQSAEQAKTDSNSFPPTVTQPKHSKRSQCKPEAVSLAFCTREISRLTNLAETSRYRIKSTR